MTTMIRSPLKAKRALEIEALVVEYKNEDTAAKRKAVIEAELTARFARVTHSIVKKYSFNPVDLEELHDYGMNGYLNALQKYDPDHDKVEDFLAYAGQEIKYGVLKSLVKQMGMTTASVKHLFFNESQYRKAVLENTPDLPERDVDALVAKRLFQFRTAGGRAIVSSFAAAQESLRDYRKRIANAYAVKNAVNLSEYHEACDAGEAGFDSAPSSTSDIFAEQAETRHIANMMFMAMNVLSPREQIAIKMRAALFQGRGEDRDEAILQDIAVALGGVSTERARQVTNKAMEKLRDELSVLSFGRGLEDISGIGHPDRFSFASLTALQKKRHLAAQEALSHQFDALSGVIVRSLADIRVDAPPMAQEKQDLAMDMEMA